MESVKRSYRAIVHFVNVANNWNDNQSDSKDLTAFKYAISRVLKSTARTVEEYNDQVTDINIDTAATNKDGHLLVNDKGGSVFTKEDSKRRNTLIRKLVETEVEIGVYYASVVPKDLTAFEIHAFAGFVIPELTEEAPSDDTA